MGVQIDALPHRTDSCSTKKGLKVFLQDGGKIDGYCFSCGEYVRHPYGKDVTVDEVPQKKVKTKEEIAQEIAEIDGYPTLTVPLRKLREATLNKFGAKVSVSEYDGVTPSAIYWPVTKDCVLVGYHVKVLNKAFPPFNLGDTKDCDLLNWSNAKVSGAYRLIITEGPEDMASVDRIYEMHGDKDYAPAVVSLPHGSASAKKTLTKHSEEIRKLFKEVVLCFDNDEAGKKAVENAMMVIPHAKAVTLPTKDANEALVTGVSKAAYNSMAFHAEAPKNTSIVFGSDIHSRAREPAKFGQLTWPFPKMNDALRGIRFKESIYLGAGVKVN